MDTEPKLKKAKTHDQLEFWFSHPNSPRPAVCVYNLMKKQGFIAGNISYELWVKMIEKNMVSCEQPEV